MASINWGDVVEITHDDAKQTLLELLDSVGFTATSWQEGEPGLALVEMVAEVWAQFSKVTVALKGFTLNSTSSGEALTKFSDSHYDNQRSGAVAAQRRISLSCSATAGPYTINLGQLVIAHPDGDTYRNVDDGVTVYPATLPSGGSLAGLVFEAEIAGLSASGKAPNTVTILQTTLAGVTVSSDAAERDGSDEEADEVLRLRNKTKWPLLTKFELTEDAVINLALNATASVSQVVVDATNPRGAGTFDVYMAGDLTTASDSDVALAKLAIDKMILGANQTPAPCLVLKAPASRLEFVATIYYRGKAAPADVKAASEAVLKTFIKTIPLGGFNFYPGPSNIVPLNDLESALRGFEMAGISTTVKVQSIGGDPPKDFLVGPFNKVVLGVVDLSVVQVN